jgi:16S rRNA (cytosine1402-N4)-methyltransferase
LDYHIPVMAEEVLRYWYQHPDGVYADCTTGGGGHSRLMLDKINEKGQLYSFDRDPEAIAHCLETLPKHPGLRLVHSEFSQIAQHLPQNSVTGILWDLGVSSRQLESQHRGFSHRYSEHVDLRMNPEEGVDARSWILQTDEHTLAMAFRQNADLDKTKPLAIALKKHLTQAPLFLMADLQSVVEDVYRVKNPERCESLLSRILQSIRMELNAELQEISESLQQGIKALVPGGRLVVITFHSVEDRVVKRAFVEMEKACICPERQPICNCGGKHSQGKRLLRKPLAATPDELKRNRRSRSALLRVFEKGGIA